MKNIIIFISGLLLTTSCQTKPQETLSTLFPDTQSATPTLLNIRPDDILEPIHLLSADSLLICTNHLADKIIRVYNLKNGLINDVISKGKAENELLDATSIWLSEDTLNVYSSNSRKILHIPFDQLSVANPNMSVTHFPQPYFDLSSCSQKNYYIGRTGPTGDSTKNQFDLLDRKGHKFNSFGPYNHQDPKTDGNELAFIYQGKLDTNHEGSKIFYASYFGSIFKFFDSSDPQNIELAKEYRLVDPTFISDSDPSKRQYGVRWEQDCQAGALATAPCKKGCFVLCEEGKQVSDPNWRMSAVYLFDWDGNPLKKLNLGRDIQTITYNESRNQLIALTVNDQEEYSFITYDL